MIRLVGLALFVVVGTLGVLLVVAGLMLRGRRRAQPTDHLGRYFRGQFERQVVSRETRTEEPARRLDRSEAFRRARAALVPPCPCALGDGTAA